ncbi:MAG: bifunctional UDP-N-acetylglucosamine diphosphorylase/glucosamine-1-phosphate N-acetyltransferase GlmU [Holosporales bacterium]|jgi:bifunctional UDP-N-acetylglucosamine pyrophosphorylase/glucosamine-1-phosphate N-acetyltransferase|nr:bifunctional UDP-N-acetylglucosamine diphosphorylase/glucosamine-1-phosphate N-acetyltransferase GlmU [Holosporales bacterium]
MVSVVILAGGKGTRMKSPTPKALHLLAGMPLIECVMRTARKLGGAQIIVVGSVALFQHEGWRSLSEKYKCAEVIQPIPLGTGHAVQCALTSIQSERVIILHADVPLIQIETLQILEKSTEDLVVTVAKNNDIESCRGRVLLHEGRPIDIIEAKNATEEQRRINIINAGMYSLSRECLHDCVTHITKNDVTNELYFTDIVRISHQRGFSSSYIEISLEEASGLDTQQDLENVPVQQILRQKMEGVVFQDAHSVVLSMDTEIGCGTKVGPFNVFGPNVTIGENATIHPFCVLEDCKIEDNCEIGPFAHIHKDSAVGVHAVVGNFVEVKKSTVGRNTKAKHLSYIGDATLGEKVNIGAGTVFCNYDGIKKHRASVGDYASIGANSSLVAPVSIGASAYIGAGSVITKDVPDATLALSRAPQVHNTEWVHKRKMRNETGSVSN